MKNRLTSFVHSAVPSNKKTLDKDILIAFGWTFLVGIPLFVLHMILFDFEHDQHMQVPFSIYQSFTQLLPHHWFSLGLWLLIIFISSYTIQRAFQQQSLLIQTQEKLALSHAQALTDGLTGVWDRMGFESLQEMTFTRAYQQSCPFSVILGDVNGLKKIQ